MMLLLVLSALVYLGGAQESSGSGYQGRVDPYRGRDDPYRGRDDPYGYDSYGRDDSRIAAAIDRLREIVEVRQQVQAIHDNRIAAVYESANENADFANTFTAYIYDRIVAFQDAQDYRLDYLEKRLAEIAYLRKTVDELHESVKDASDDIDYQQKEIKTAQYDVDCLENDGIDISSRIAVAQQRADAVMAAIDDLEADTQENKISLSIEELNVRQLIDAANRQMAVSPEPAYVRPNSQDATIVVPFNLVSTPQFSLASITGFRVRNQRPYGYYQGYPTIYFELETDVNRREATITGIDMSDGGYTTQRIYVDVDAIYFDTADFPKSFLEGITGFS